MAGKTSVFVDNSAPSVDATWLNGQQTEQQNEIESSGQTLSDATLDQRAIAMASYAAQGGVFCTDSGTANTYVLTQVSSFKAPYSLKNGLTLKFRAGNANTGASTVNPFGLGVKNILQADGSTAVAAGMISIDEDTDVRYDGTSFRLTGASSITSSVSNPNILINGDFRVAQRGTTFTSATTPANSDDTYLLDRQLLLSDGNDAVDVSQETTTVPTGSYAACKFDQETANKQWGYVQIIEARNAAQMIGGVASLSFKARKGGANATLEILRAAIVAWDGTADAVTSDLVGTWAGAGTNPTLAANWTYENTPSNLTLTTSYQTFKIENVSIDTSGAKNVAVFIWVDDIDATIADLVYITDIKLEAGAVATSFISNDYGNELVLCQRYCEKITNTGSGQVVVGLAQGAGRGYFSIPWKAQKRSVPTVSVSAVGDFIPLDGSGAPQAAFTTINNLYGGEYSCMLDIEGSSGLTAGQACPVSFASGFVLGNSEL